MLLAQINSKIQQEIPLAKSMGFQILEISEKKAVSTIPLNPNKNHLGTVFGGSIYSGTALTCYALLLSEIINSKLSVHPEIVIAHGDIRYLAPIGADPLFEASFESKWDASILENQKRWAGKMKAKVFCSSQLCAEFEGLYIAKVSR